MGVGVSAFYHVSVWPHEEWKSNEPNEESACIPQLNNNLTIALIL